MMDLRYVGLFERTIGGPATFGSLFRWVWTGVEPPTRATESCWTATPTLDPNAAATRLILPDYY